MTHPSTFAFLAALAILPACAAPAPAPAVRPVAAEVLTQGEPIYVGTVFPLGAPAGTPHAFRYERRVETRDGLLVSTHVTRDPAGAVAVAESAVHASDYTLRAYTLHTDQQGRGGSVEVDGDTITLRRLDRGGQRTSVERHATPVAVGPTLVGVIARNLPALRAGAVVPLRLAVLDRLETIGFELEAVEAPAGETRVRMKPSSFAFALVVDPVTFTFDRATGKITRLEGRVPPKRVDGGKLRDLDARVEYRYLAAAYR